MPRRHSLDEIKQNLFNLFGNDVMCLSTEYKSNKDQMLFQCKCGNPFTSTYNRVSKGFIRCKECSSVLKSKVLRDPFDSILEIIRNSNCEYIDGEYVNCSSKLTLKCRCGNTFVRDVIHLKRGQTTCNECYLKEASERNRIPFEELKNRISKIGCEYISGDYVNGKSILVFKCACGNKFERSVAKVLYGQINCYECAKKMSADARRKYEIADSPFMNINTYLRSKIIPWKK